jgi:ribosomal-protein-serine acetyltransferase
MDKELRSQFRLDDEITLRTFVEGDAEMVFETVLRNREHLQAFMHWMTADYSIDSAREFIARAAESRAKKENAGYGIFSRNKLIGSIGFVSFDWKSRKTEIGYWIVKEEEGKGIITRLCQLLITYVFEELEMNRIEIHCSAENVRSAAIPERLGFTREGCLRQAELRGGRLHDFIIFGLLADDPRLW